MTDFKQGDKIRVSYETTIRNDFGDYTGKYLLKGPSARNRNVELIEPADDPSKDPIGTVRQRGEDVYTRSDYNENYPWVGFDEYSGNEHESMRNSEIIGAVPGTPAAEAQKPAERPLWTGDGSEEPPEYVTKVRDSDGDVMERTGRQWRYVTFANGDLAVGSTWMWSYVGAPFTEVRDA